MSTRNQTRVSALELLRQYLELCRYTPDQRDWNEQALEPNPPRLIRLQRLKALFHAFGIPFDPQSFQEGGFIDCEDPVYEVFLERARSQFLKEGTEGRHSGTNQVTAFYLRPVFKNLLKYRIALEEPLTFNRGVSVAGDLFYFEFLKINELNRVIRDHIAIIEDLLVEVISPTRRTFSRKQLVKEHGYPDVDLDEIDFNWF